MTGDPNTTDPSPDAAIATGSPNEEWQVQRDALDYIAQLGAELAALARHSRFDLVAYLLEMAVAEAGTARRKLSDPP